MDQRFRVLLIEDNPHDARLIELMLDSAKGPQFELDVVQRVEHAEQWLAEHVADVILLDLSLPDSQGLETFEAINAARPDTPIVVLSGLQNEQVALGAVKAGAQDYLVKAQDSDDAMVRAIHYAIERFNAGRTLRQREEHMRLLTEQLPCNFWTTDRQLRMTSCSGQGLVGQTLSNEEVIGRSLLEYFDSEEARGVIEAAHREAAKGSSRTFDLPWREHVYHVHVEPFRQRQGRIIGAIGVALDVTDQKSIDLELRVARQVQEGLRPQQAPQLPCFAIAGASYSAAAAGGDYFDYLTFRDGSTGIVVCDVAGHGLGPAMMMCQTRAYLRAVAQHHDDPGEILALVNRFLYGDTNEERLVALFLAKLPAERACLHYANAGHRGYLLRLQAAPQLLPPTGIPLNVLDNPPFTSAPPVPLGPGDLVLLYTDGIIEATDAAGVQFGAKRMLDLVDARREESADDIVRHLFAAVHAFSPQAGDQDDMTAVIIKVTG